MAKKYQIKKIKNKWRIIGKRGKALKEIFKTRKDAVKVVKKLNKKSSPPPPPPAPPAPPSFTPFSPSSDIEDLEEEINTLLDEIGGDEPTEEQSELLAELNEALEMSEELDGDLGEGLDDDLETRRERLIDGDPVTLEDGDVDTWERWTQDYQ